MLSGSVFGLALNERILTLAQTGAYVNSCLSHDYHYLFLSRTCIKMSQFDMKGSGQLTYFVAYLSLAWSWKNLSTSSHKWKCYFNSKIVVLYKQYNGSVKFAIYLWIHTGSLLTSAHIEHSVVFLAWHDCLTNIIIIISVCRSDILRTVFNSA